MRLINYLYLSLLRARARPSLPCLDQVIVWNFRSDTVVAELNHHDSFVATSATLCDRLGLLVTAAAEGCVHVHALAQADPPPLADGGGTAPS